MRVEEVNCDLPTGTIGKKNMSHQLPLSERDIPTELPWLHMVSFLESVGSRSLKTEGTYLAALSNLTTLALQSNAITGPLDPALEGLAMQVKRAGPKSRAVCSAATL